MNLFAKSSSKLDLNGDRRFTFYCVTPGNGHELRDKIITDGAGYDTIELALQQGSFANGLSEKEVNRYIAEDFQSGFGTYFPEYNCISWLGPHEIHKPIVTYEFEGKTKYVTHPQIHLMLWNMGSQDENTETGKVT